MWPRFGGGSVWGLYTRRVWSALLTLQLEARRIANPADQLRVVRHVALSYRSLLEAPLDLIGG